MYIILEYLAWLSIVAVLGTLAFAASAALIATREGARRAVRSSRQLGQQLGELAKRTSEANQALSAANQPIAH